MYSVINVNNYDCMIGLDALNQSRDYLKNFIKSKAIVITDENVDRYHHKTLDILLDDLEIEHEFYVIKPGESSKCLSEYEKIINYMSLSYHRNDTVIAFGGGVVGDLAGFVAATFMRGIDFIQIPTTVLSMVDSSVGSKTGIDLPTGKNLIGAFKDPALCIIDPLLLKTLDDYVFEDGFGEIIKYAICFDEELFDMISSRRYTKQSNLSEIVEICVTIKKDIVLKDKLEQNLRRLLNYGHTLGHAVEKLSDYSVMHGHGVAYGMKCMAKKYSKDYDKILEVLEMYNLDDSYDYSVDDVYDVTLRDKKNTKDIISLIISEKVGDCTILSMNKSDYKKVLSDIYED
ncbi:3-dehydroquinate synthase [Finegoldia magna]|uniref:3-dehydroquinate synthase n=1 Tax=Finegoldia magna TaxID=1260 RepID=UPI000B91C918|nr:3-dehydroquinate synthase [Finegoldia magna]OXZ40668.1 3-dehydroquinate synthase [Finegoldia magna]